VRASSDAVTEMVQTVQALKLNPERIAPVHGRVVPYRNLLMAFDLGTPAPAAINR